ncbi:MAG: SpoIIE family protein phosphatase [Steroidobacteraceae bacterium]
MALAVEDDGFERLRLAAILERLGFEVVLAADGAEALSLLTGQPPDVLITDWQLPALSGLDLCRAVRGGDPARRPYTVLVTARDQLEDLVEGLESGADDFIAKPYRAEELSARLRSGQRLLEMRRALVERTGMLEQALRHHRRGREVLEADLAAAARLQHQLLERALAPVPGLAIAHLFRPAQKVGGDIYGVARLAGDRAGFFHIDATGHGISAALHGFAIATALLGLGGRAVEFDDPAAWVHAFNGRALEVGADIGCSLVVGWLDLGTRGGRLCQAGHPHPLAVARDGAVRVLGSGGLPVGAIDGARYRSCEFELASGERLVLHSDGVTDCEGPTGQPFGTDRLRGALASAAAADLDGLLRAVGRALDDWRGTATHDDDVSLLILEPGDWP